MQVQSDATTMMVCWTPGTSAMALVPWPDATMQSNQYRSSAGACYTEVREGSFEYRKTMIFILAMTMIVRDKCPAESVHETLLGLAEYRDGCPDDMPGI
ncbi:TPA: hypothetical protein ACUB60_005275 [Klebsiella variicola]|uniref:hypothetical protein n=1 Tax=Citrobacter portucalensis TaxID=1639133 RepID=UPI000518F955|nr:hypothetical protein [Citrobacter portucalensis]EAO2851284.1 hypothetical protein [Salmonella enterica]EIT0169636.1 hypothetical protein [Escherichia coli]ELK3459286.1 hypothetical protein [Enterobacter kobei]EMC2649120.1 hypothetical protein [Klebsiella pneumoniae]HCB1534959.1 hypothetical protein [Citrobacter braakii]HCB1793797.1 hypothetical protein [Klebsiella quasipneumoniae]HDL6532516.1 hypothetical protein [Yersinia enterocolitica]HDR2780130.1 hypothetical protein [Enterobacter mo